MLHSRFMNRFSIVFGNNQGMLSINWSKSLQVPLSRLKSPQLHYRFDYASIMLRAILGISSGLLRLSFANSSTKLCHQGKRYSNNKRTTGEDVPRQSRTCFLLLFKGHARTTEGQGTNRYIKNASDDTEYLLYNRCNSSL